MYAIYKRLNKTYIQKKNFNKLCVILNIKISFCNRYDRYLNEICIYLQLYFWKWSDKVEESNFVY